MMEYSSPLAAMQPPPCPRPWGCGRDVPASRPLFGRHHTFGGNSFSFKDASIKSSNTDYFSMKPVRGSSPAASLAADLSQNFHIDQSPQLPTPRRSLFTSSVLQGPANRERATTPPCRWEGVTTPPIPPSSPGYGNDMMDMSPLPHKAPFSVVTQFTVQSPTPAPTPPDETMDSAFDVPLNPPMDLQRTFVLPERRKSSLLRPSLARTKFFSTNSVTQSKGVENKLPSFTFGVGSSGLSQSSTPTLDECFTESPPQDRKMVTNPVMAPPKPRQLFSSSNSFSRGTGSPVTGHIKKPVGPAVARPRKLFRRSLSMFEHPGDVMKQEDQGYTPTGLQSIMDIDDTHKHQLPHFIPLDEPDSLPRIDQDTMIAVLNGDYDHLFDEKVVVDCRFEYEYNGGHIEGAENHTDKEKFARDLFNGSSKNRLLIFHCEYSAHRAPLTAKYVRQQDRAFNAAQYPKLTYPEVYILDGGYSSFFKIHRTRCFPQNYVEMQDEKHENACERGLNKLKQRGKLSRAQTFAFGQHGCSMEDSPTAQGRSHTVSLLPADLITSNFFDPRPTHSRRQASY